MVSNFNDRLIEQIQEQVVAMGDQLEALNSISGKLQQTIILSANGNSIVNQPMIDSDYTSFRLIGVAAYLDCDATAGDRILTLELVNDNAIAGFPTIHSKTAVYSGYQGPTMSGDRHYFWAENNGNDNWSRQPIPGINLTVGNGYRWRVRNFGTIGADDLISCQFFIQVT